jgi:DNA-binding CsgD family transcriptional regulator
MNEQLSKMRRQVHQKFPAGLLDDDMEISTTGDFVFALIAGKMTPFAAWPESLKIALKEDLQSHPKAIQSLIELGLETDDEMIWQYSRCRFGSWDGQPDLVDGKFIYTEYWDCGIRGNCAHEGKLCCSMKVEFGIISAREMQVWVLVCEGLLNKEIADRLSISDTTVPQHVENLCRKCGVRHRGELSKLGYSLNIS